MNGAYEHIREEIARDIEQAADRRAIVHTDADDPMLALIEGLRFAARIARGEVTA